MKEKLQSRQNTKAEESFQFSSTDQSEMLDFISRHSVLYLQFPLWTFLHRQSIRYHYQTYHCHPADIPFPACDARQQQSLKAQETEGSNAVVTVYGMTYDTTCASTSRRGSCQRDTHNHDKHFAGDNVFTKQCCPRSLKIVSDELLRDIPGGKVAYDKCNNTEQHFPRWHSRVLVCQHDN